MVFYLNCISHHHRKIAFSGCTHENHHTLSQRFYTYTIPYNHARDSDRNAQKRNNNKKSNNLFKLKCNALYQKHWCRLNGCVCLCAFFSIRRLLFSNVCSEKLECNLHQKLGIYDYQLRITKIYDRKSL